MVLAIDASTAVVNASANSSTSGSFTPAANSLLIVLWNANTTIGTNPTAGPTITDNLGTHLTYTQQAWERRLNTGLQDGECAIWTAPVTTSTAMTLTITNGSGAANPDHSYRILWATDTSQPTAGAVAKNSSGSGTAIAMSYTATATGSWGIATVCDWDFTGVETAGAGTTLISSAASATNQIDYGFFRRTTADGVNGSTTTLNATLPASSTNLTWAAIEIVPAGGGAGVTGGEGFFPKSPPKTTPFGILLPQFRIPSFSSGPNTAPAILLSTLDLIPTNGTAPTSGNSNIGGTANNGTPNMTASTDLAHPHGGLTTQKFSWSGTQVNSLAYWQPSKWNGAPPSGSTYWCRLYFYQTVLPDVVVNIVGETTAGFGTKANIRMNSTGNLFLFNANTSAGSTTSQVPLNTWVRIEYQCFLDGTTGQMQLRYYANPESINPTEVLVGSVGNTIGGSGTKNIEQMYIGNAGGNNTTGTMYISDAQFSNAGWIGPMTSYTVQPLIGWGWGVMN